MQQQRLLFKMIRHIFLVFTALIFSGLTHAETLETLTPDRVRAFDLGKSGLVGSDAREVAWVDLARAEKLYWDGRLGDLQSLRALEKGAAGKDPAAMAYWGLIKALGAGGIEVDAKARDQLFKESFPFIQRAAEQGVPAAQNILGFMYLHEEGIPGVLPKDAGAGFAWTKKAAEAGHPLAQNNFGKLYEKGIGTAPNLEAALMWYRRAADQGHALSAVNLGRAYESGDGVAKNEKTALWYYILAAQKGHLLSYHPIGEMYRDGRGGLKQDDAQAILWFKAAADKGSFRAQRDLGEMYEQGRGVPKDKAQAIALYRKAVAQGDKEAKAHLERLGMKDGQ